MSDLDPTRPEAEPDPVDVGGPVGAATEDGLDLLDTEPTALPDELAGLVAELTGEAGTVPWRALLAETAALLADAGIDGAEQEARWIVEEATGREGAELVGHLDDPATVGGVAALDRMVARRIAGEPLQYVLGHWGFRGLDLMVDPRVLIPRPETEGVVDHVLSELDRLAAERAAESGAAPPAVVVDLGCGSGAIGLALAAERRDATVHLVDRSPGAVAVARANLAGLGIAGATVTIHEGSWFDPLPPDLRGTVHVVVANPPYVAPDDEVDAIVSAHEPREALIPGPTGLEAIAEILRDAPEHLVPSGAVVVEIGADQGPAVVELAVEAGLVEVEVRPDLAGRDRVLVARRPAEA